MEIGRVVRSNAGHDGDRFYAVVAVDADAVWIADGKCRKRAKPKRKNPRHLSKTKNWRVIEIVEKAK